MRLGGLTFLGVEEQEGFVECKGVIIRWRRAWRAPRQRFGDDDWEADHEEGDGEGGEGPLYCGAAAHNASKIYVFVLLLFLLIERA